MKKINITVVCGELTESPSCVELLEGYPEFNLVAQATDLEDDGIWDALAGSDVLILDEAVLEETGYRSIRKLHDNYPTIRSLMVVEGEQEYKTIAAVSLGVQGVICKSSMISMLRKAVISLYSGEAWLPRGLVQPLRDQVNREDNLACRHDLSSYSGYRGKLN